MNLHTQLAEDAQIAASLQTSLHGFFQALSCGELDPQYMAPEDQQRHAFFANTLLAAGASSQQSGLAPLVLKSWSPDGNAYRITVAFFGATDAHTYIDKILELHAYPVDDGYRFQSPFDHNAPLPTHQIDNVTFHANPPLREQRAQEFAAFHQELHRLVHAAPQPLDYYRFDSLDELLRTHGIVYDVNKCNSLAKDLGFLDGDGQLYLTGTGDERYIFGYVCDLLRRHCDAAGDLYSPFVNGMAAYYGGYSLSGDDMATLKQQFRAKLTADPTFDCLQAFRAGRSSSINRHFTYFVICALICEEVVTQHGFDHALTLARSGRQGEQFFSRLHSILGVDEANLDALVKRLIQA